MSQDLNKGRGELVRALILLQESEDMVLPGALLNVAGQSTGQDHWPLTTILSSPSSSTAALHQLSQQISQERFSERDCLHGLRLGGL